MKTKNKQLPFLAYFKRLNAILLMKECEQYGKQDLFIVSDVINVDPANPNVDHYPSSSIYQIDFSGLEVSRMKEVNELNQEQKRTAFISILDNYKVKS